MECADLQPKEQWQWCNAFSAYTNLYHCLTCQRVGREYIESFFARRDAKRDMPVAPRRSRGVGDTVAKAIHKVTLGKVKPCGGCKKRQRKLNERFPYKNREKQRA